MLGDDTYLVEVRVSNVRLDASFKCAPGPLRVVVRLPGVQPLNLCLTTGISCYNQPEVPVPDGEGHVAEGSPAETKGESCVSHMFQMDPAILLQGLKTCPLYVSVHGVECPELPESLMGTAKFFVTDDIIEAICRSTESPKCPITASMSGSFSICNVFGESAGDANVCLRLSCFGKSSACPQDQFPTLQPFAEDQDISGGGRKGPLVTGADNLAPGAAGFVGGGGGVCGGSAGAVAWRLATDRKPRQPVCTCAPPSPPVSPGPPPPEPCSVKCECAELLAALRCPPPPFTCCQPPATPQHPATTPPPPPPPPVPAAAMAGAPPAGPTSQQTSYPPPPPLDEPHPIPTSLPTPPRPPGDTSRPATRSAAQQIPSRTQQDTLTPTSKFCATENAKNKIKDKDPAGAEKSPVANKSNAPTTPKSTNGNLDESKRAPLKNKENKVKKVQNEIKKKKKMKIKNIYVHTAGMYPGLLIGHKYCCPVIRLVPRNMGWLWNLMDENAGDGWMPGAVTKVVNENFHHWKVAARNQPHTDTLSSGMLGAKKKKKGVIKGADEMSAPLKPTLHVHKKDGHYFITVHPAGEEPPGAKPLAFKVDAHKASSDEITSEGSTEDSFEFQYNCPASLFPPKRDVEKVVGFSQYNEADFMPKGKKEKNEPPLTCSQDDKKKENGGGDKEGDKKGKKGDKKGGKGKPDKKDKKDKEENKENEPKEKPEKQEKSEKKDVKKGKT